VASEAVGEAFNPWRRFPGIMVPDPILASGLGLGAKVCYGVLARFAGKDGKCFPSLQAIGKRIGVSDRQVRSYVAELVRAGYLVKVRRGTRKSNRYIFIWHPSFDGAERKDSSGESGRILPTEENQLTEELDLDYLPTQRKRRDAPSEVTARCPSNGRKSLSDLVEGLVGRKPSDSALGRIVGATPGKTESEAIEAVQDAVLRGYGAGSRHGARCMTWFVSVARNYWTWRERYSLPPAASARGAQSQEFARMTEAIELPDPP